MTMACKETSGTSENMATLQMAMDEYMWQYDASLAGNGNVRVYGPKEESLLQSRRAKIAKYVAATAEVSSKKRV